MQWHIPCRAGIAVLDLLRAIALLEVQNSSVVYLLVSTLSQPTLVTLTSLIADKKCMTWKNFVFDCSGVYTWDVRHDYAT
jgi:hypothetical protein